MIVKYSTNTDTIHASGKPSFEAYRCIADCFHKVPAILHDNLQRHSHKPYDPVPQLYNFSYYIRRPILVLSALCRSTLADAHMTSRTFQTYDHSLGSLKKTVSEAGHFVKLILL
jgi:hypothetical protein